MSSALRTAVEGAGLNCASVLRLSKKRSTPQRDSKIEPAWLLEDMLGAVEALPSNRPS
jgi:hypothetical protein